MLADLGPSDRSGRRALGLSCLLIVVLLFGWGMLCAGLIVTTEFASRPGTALVGMTAATGLALPYLFIILWLDRNEPEPPWLLATAFAWGAVGATTLSILGNGLLGGVFSVILGAGPLAEQATASISAPLVEEPAKAVALLAIYVLFRGHFDNVLDGIVYGAMVGLGFAVFENFLYYMKPDHLGGTFVMIWVRGVVTSPGTHICFTAIMGAFVGFFRVRRGGAARWLLLPMGLTLAAFAHFCWNTLTMFFGTGHIFTDMTIGLPLAVLFLQVPFLCMVLFTAAVALRHERRIIETFLANEEPPIVFPRELVRLVPARRRTFQNLRLLLLFRFGDWWTTRRRNRALVQLAFEKWHMDREATLGTHDARDHALAVRELRRHLKALPAPPG
jgi:RsiW-degrading membrane proteinase PrsW (M82 family)